ncbi:MAG: pilus assembly PilX N-terminal domain-containing protein [Candidatus Saccharimonadales bacterium]
MTQPHSQSDQRGFASIVIALTLVIILALLTVGFAQLTRREQRNALNKQLATQAYYAAESGINDAIADIKADKIANSNVDCTPDARAGQQLITAINQIDTRLDVSYSCVSINLDPVNLSYTNMADSSYRSVVFSSASGAPVSTITVNWTSTSGRGATRGVASGLQQKTSWNDPALMEIGLTPLNNLNRDALTANNYTVYGYPVTGSTEVATYSGSASAGEGLIRQAHCDAATKQCSLTISGLAATGSNTFLLHLTDHYDQSNVTVSGTDANGPLAFHGAQAVIDATGRARGVLKRLQVHVPLNPSSPLPNYAIEANSVCKRITTYPTSGANADDFHDAIAGFVGGSANPGSPCYLN